MATCFLGFAFLLARLAAQPPLSFQDLAPELASKIAAAVGSGNQVTLTMVTTESDLTALMPIEAELRQALAAREIRLVEGTGASTALQVGCTSNLRERACVAELRRGTTRELVVVTRPLDARDERRISPSLELMPMFSQRAPILDVVLFGNRLLVLDPERVTLYEQIVERAAVAPPALWRATPELASPSSERRREASAERTSREVSVERANHETSAERGRWKQLESRPITTSRPWPRDVRGRLRRDEATVTAWLPGVTCRGSADLSRFACADERGVPWPIAIENTGIDAARNYFYTPEGLPFYGAAALGADADPRWLVVSGSGELLFLDKARRTIEASAAADDVIALDTSCAPAAHVVVASSTIAENRRDELRLYRVAKRQLIPVSAPIDVPGRLTALWSEPGAVVATAVAQDMTSERYEAFHIRVSCVGE
jgi:hypothetical protein